MFRRIVVILMLILAIALVACGSGEEAEPAESGQAAAADSGSAAEPETVPAEPATATPVEPTATPEPPPTPTLAPTPTEAVAEAQPEAEQESTGAGDAASGSGWGASKSGAQSACDHAFMPLRPGATWTYEGGEGALIWEVVDVQGDMDDATAVVTITVGDVTLDYQWQCAAGEGLSSFDFANLAAAPVGIDLTIEQVSVDGQFLLPAEQLVPGATWTTELESTISFSQTLEGTSIGASGDMTTVQQNTVTSADPVEFDGQSVPGIQIEQINSITMLLSMMGTAMEQAMTVSNNLYLGYGIGIVSQSSVTDFGTETMNLVSYSIP